MTPAQVKRMEAYRRKKLQAWIEELGFDDELLQRFDAGDFWQKDEAYEEARDMVKEDRRFQSGYRRMMRGSK